MKRISVWAAILAVVCTGATIVHSQAKDAERSQQAAAAIGRATGLALRGDAASAVKALIKLPASSFTGKDATFRSCMRNRFGATAQPISALAVSDSLVSTLATNYIAYWRRALSRPKERDSAERDLRSAIGKLLGRSVNNDNEFDTAEDGIMSEAEKRGFHVLLGRTPPLRELVLWKKRSVGGWATDKGLFAVVPAYESLQDETFSVRFLAHESQHFADKQAFPNLESWELEYRAKLVELALATESQASTVELICENRGTSKESSHGYADTHVVDDVTKFANVQPGDLCDKKTLKGQVLRDGAKRGLSEDSKRRREKGQGSGGCTMTAAEVGELDWYSKKPTGTAFVEIPS
jgi:hypothetical protein